ncbi:MAG: F0F1 ATP synthase subunit A [Candidatus Kerfeldbacteria bacterium]|nr:F0F1 ATP synthase subunit A [Candidatus Kerfeldbacteria bacterium]
MASEYTESDSGVAISLKPEVLGHLGPLPVTNSFLFSLVIMVGLVVTFAIGARRLKAVPGKIQVLGEALVMGMYNFVLTTTGNNKRAANFIFPIFLTLFLFILTSNLMGFLPGTTSIHYGEHHFFRPPTADFGFIFSVTLLVFALIQLAGFYFSGIGYLKKFFDWSSPINFAIGLLELVGELAKMMSLSFRLFGNIFAEEVLALVVLSLVPFIAPVPFSLIGFLVSIVQAFIYPILVLIYITLALAHGSHSPTPEPSSALNTN